MTQLFLKRIYLGVLSVGFFTGTISKADTAVLSPHQNNLLISELEKKANQGEVKAQIELGARYETGSGLPQNTKAAERYFKEAAEQGNAEAEYNLGLLYYKGTDTSPDFKKAHDYFTKAAAQDSPEACIALGIMSSKGEFIPKDMQKAQMYFQRAEKLKKERIIVKGTPTPASKKEDIYRTELEKIEKRAEYGDAKDQYALGMMYFHGRGVRKNTEKSKDWFQKACNQDMEAACDAYKDLCKGDNHSVSQDMAEMGLADVNGSPMDDLPTLGKIF